MGYTVSCVTFTVTKVGLMLIQFGMKCLKAANTMKSYYPRIKIHLTTIYVELTINATSGDMLCSQYYVCQTFATTVGS